MSMKIGIGITTHNRKETFEHTLGEIIRWLPEGAVLAIVDDASQVDYTPNTYGRTTKYRFTKNVGVARAKNKCLEILYNEGCEYIFLFDDDTYPLAANWHEPYIQSGQPHLMYIFQHFTSGKSPHDMIKYYDDGQIAAYSHVRGCMLYYHRTVLDVVGGFDVSFGKWGHEHGDLSNRIYSAGLTRFRYMDVSSSKGLFYAADEQEHGKFVSTVPSGRRILLDRTQPIYDAHYNLPVYCEFRERGKGKAEKGKTPLFMSAFLTEQPDPQRPGHKWEIDTELTAPYEDTIYLTMPKNGQRTVILYDDPKPNNFALSSTRWERVQSSINPYFQRWISYYEYLINSREEISWVFMTDCTDVELLKMPEPQPGTVYVGDEPDKIGKAVWLSAHHKHPTLQRFYKTHGHLQMLNAGILGGYIDDVLPFVRSIIDTYVQFSHDSQMKGTQGPGMTDMGVFNYVAYTQFADQISHGTHVNTTFKANERNDISWFKHK